MDAQTKEVMDILQEECAEVIQAVSKISRFGIDNFKPGKPKTNREHLEEELGDLQAMVDILQELDIVDAFNQLYKFCWGAKRVWSNGSCFDIIICEHVFRKINRAVPWKFWEVRDVRTAFDLGINPQRPPVTAHHALEDAWNQAVGIQNVYNTLRTSTTYSGEMLSPFANQR